MLSKSKTGFSKNELYSDTQRYSSTSEHVRIITPCVAITLQTGRLMKFSQALILPTRIEEPFS